MCKAISSIDTEIEPLNQRQLWNFIENVKMNAIEHAKIEEMGSTCSIFHVRDTIAGKHEVAGLENVCMM